MKCPNCGNEIDDGKLYCEGCGAEIQIVPDIDIDFQSQLDDTMMNIADNEFRKDSKDDELEYDDDPSIIQILLSNIRGGKILYTVLIALFVVAIIVATLVGIKIYQQNSPDYQIELSQKALSDGKVEEAISYLEKASKLDKNNSDILFTMADYYYSIQKIDDAIYTLTDIAKSETFDSLASEKAYKKIISLYETENNYEAIAELLADCSNTSVNDLFYAYRSDVPTLSQKEGTYKEVVALKIESNIPGKIYYTTDGMEPTVNSPIYENPIFLEYGKYNILAMFVNNYGVKSEIVKANFIIDTELKFEPEVLTESNSYDKGTLICVQVPVGCTVYYTNDGTDPTKSSQRYSYPVPMPVGNSTYKFISYAADGTASEIVERKYSLALNNAISPATAVDTLVNGLVDRGVLLATDGTKEGSAGKYLYIYSTIMPIEGMGDFYFVVEYYEDYVGNRVKSGMIYAVDVYNGMLYKVSSEGNGTYILAPF